MATLIHQRIDQLSAIGSIEELISSKIGRCHSLSGNRKDEYALDLVHPYRLVFKVNKQGIQIATIQEIVDYH